MAWALTIQRRRAVSLRETRRDFRDACC